TGACAGCLESAYREWADTGGIEPGNPAGTDVIRQRSALRQRHAVEAHGKVSRTGGSDRGSGIVDDEALRDRKGDAQPRMQEGMAAYIAFLGRVAEQHAVDAGEERVAVALSDARRPDQPGVSLRQCDALRRVRMRCKEVETGVGGA